MAQTSEIEWTDATWNPVTGCTKVGPGCDNCYAERFAERWRGVEGHPYEQGFDLRHWPTRLDQPARWTKPRMIFVNSMSDLFHKEIDRKFIDQVFDTMETAHWHVYQVLTKRSSLMRRYVRDRYRDAAVPEHIWLGVSAEDAEHAGRIEHLRQIRSPARFISFEPLLGPIGAVDLSGIAWGDCRGRERPEGAPHGAVLGNGAPRPLPAIRRRLLLQAVGRGEAEVRGTAARGPRMERIPLAGRAGRDPGVASRITFRDGRRSRTVPRTRAVVHQARVPHPVPASRRIQDAPGPLAHLQLRRRLRRAVGGLRHRGPLGQLFQASAGLARGGAGPSRSPCEERPASPPLPLRNTRKAVAELRRFAANNERFDIVVFHGKFEDNLDAIAAECRDGFTFTFIDPTGWNIRSGPILDFLRKQDGEFLLNFMSEHINRHAGYPAIAASIGRFLADPDWESAFDALPPDRSNEERGPGPAPPADAGEQSSHLPPGLSDPQTARGPREDAPPLRHALCSRC